MASRACLLAAGLLLATIAPPTTACAQALPEQDEVPAEAPADGATEREVAAGLDQGRDQAIRQRLEATFERVEGLGPVRVEVDAGVVRLDGEVPDEDARALAGQLARQVEDVALVDNRLRPVRDLDARLEVTVERLRERGLDLLALLPLLLIALLVVLAFWLAGGWLARRGWPFRTIDNGFLRETARQLTRIGALLAGALLALEILDATALVAAVLGTAGLFGLVLGFAFRDLAENAIASLLLSLRQPFAPNDLVRIEDQEGHVVRLTSRATILLTIEGNHVRIPNATVYKGVLVNYTRNPLRRFDFVAGVGVDDDLTRARELGIAELGRTPAVLDDPAPEAFVEALGDSNVAVRYVGWVDQQSADYLKVKSEAIRRVKEALDGAGISLPEPTYIVRLREEKGRAAPAAPAAPEGARSAAVDVRRADVVERQASAERAASGPDLLDPEAPREL
ncbi:MAG: mechanosensitive ion channel family protein [Geminicoccaceae bacterium]|nr:mechanosensitive ion channel family protein [Geminicoccaceae bacterium]